MGPTEPVLINSRPLRACVYQSISKTTLELEEEVYEDNFHSWGIVVWSKDGNGEVLVSEGFEDAGLHFIYTRATVLNYPSEHDPLGVGSIVKVFWSRSFERVMAGRHIIVQIERMDIYKCARMFPERVFVTFNSQASPGVAIGVTERNITVAFHPNCAPRSRYETLKAFHDGRTEFEMPYKHYENTNRMVEVVLAVVPFRVDIKGNFDKIPFFVIKKCEYTPGMEGVAVITKIQKYHFMEAYYLQTSERVYFDSKSCHSNIMEKITVGSLINLLASPAFSTSCYKWYGYDVTMCNKYLADANTQKSFKMKDNKILRNFGDDKEKPSMKYARTAFYKNAPDAKNDEQDDKVIKPKKKSSNLYKFDSKKAQYKVRHILLDKCFSLLNPVKAKGLVDCYFIGRATSSSGVIYNEFGNVEHKSRYNDLDDHEEEVDENEMKRAAYSQSLQNGIRDVLEPFGLNRPQQDAPEESSSAHLLLMQQTSETDKKKKKRPDLPKITPDDVRNRIGSLIDSNGFALNQKIAKQFVLPDTRWKPRERRWIGLDDDVQWVMMATFCPIPENPSEKKELLGGWWYRRGVPREAPVLLVERLDTRRNVIKDCTESQMI